MTSPYFTEVSKGKDEKWLLDEKYGGLRNPRFEADVKRLASGEPLSYVIGHQPFMGLTIYLDSHPLIPRPETEWWTEKLVSSLQEQEAAVRLLDLCAGSGAIGCAALASLPYMEVFFGEIDPAHETIIRKNIRENHLDESRTHISIGDLFEPFENMTFDIIAANPPYVPAGRTLEQSVADYEPALALRAGDDGLAIIRRIATELPKHLTKSGVAWIEVDSAHAAAPTPEGIGAPTESVGAACALFTSQGLAAEIRTDQYGAPRVILVSFP
ncbi:MAG: peptide chain release factor N(5)-glutamine methyltransferase [Candidatus Pacebacteria bacterium]|nr:peptide chain release factor N(5)-glutamine methyltransferase [Candidatus Paceibacterota bacterium]